jgi:cobalt/nickel transport protein
MSLWQRNVLLMVVVVLLAVGPLVFLRGAEWGGADMQSMEAIQEIQRDYQPWFSPIYSPEDMERWFFGLQALIGMLAVSAFVGWLVGRHRAQTGTEGNERRVAAVLATAGVVIAVALFFVETEFGEIQAFISAVQGLGLGLPGFFAGYPAGKRAGLRSPVRVRA